MEGLRMYILVNEDIKIGKGKLAGQVGHAVGTWMYRNMLNTYYVSDLDIINKYMENHQVKIILKCPQVVLEDLENKGYVAIRDKGWTQLEPDTLTCVNLGILDSLSLPEELDFIRELKLI